MIGEDAGQDEHDQMMREIFAANPWVKPKKVKAPDGFTQEDALAALFTVRCPMAQDGIPDEAPPRCALDP